jgi:amidophosphoribosyltransferase
MKSDGKLKEECGVFGVCLKTDEAVGITYNGLLSLQHRGQEGAGIAVVRDNNIFCRKSMGLVSEVFSNKELDTMPRGEVAIGHTRYSTTGSSKKENIGPFVTEYLTGRIATAHNGNIINAKRIREELKSCGLQFGATSDSEVISSLLAYRISEGKDVVSCVVKVAEQLDGAYSLIIATGTGKLIAVRDPNGYRPLCLGRNQAGYAVASESCALDTCGFTFIRDILPGEVTIIEKGEIVSHDIVLKNKENTRGLCIFEYVYFARPDSVIDGLSVYKARYNMGMVLAEEHPADVDVVCGVPDSGLDAASGYSVKSGIPLISGFVKNRYIGRSFIYPTQSERESAVRLKLNPLVAAIGGKRVVLVDDSIVRGTTSERIVRSLKNAGAKEVHVRVSSPPFRYTCHYGTDIDDEENLIANKMSLDKICNKIGADSLGYISIKGLQKACCKCKLPFCMACFKGGYKSEYSKKGILEQ